MKVFLIPFAGGTSIFYSKWMDKTIEFIPLDYSGHGKRIGEGLKSSVEETAQDLLQIIKEVSRDEEYAIFGHSLGGLVAYEVYKNVVHEGVTDPKHIFISGCRAPHIKPRNRISELEGEAYKNAVLSLGGVEERFFQDKQVFEMFNPILKNDLRISEQYAPLENIKFQCGVTIFNGIQDESVNGIEKLSWKKYCMNECKFRMYQGDHFYLGDCSKEIIEEMRNTLYVLQ